MFAELVGADALDRQFSALPADIAARLEAKARGLAAALAAKVRDEKLSGQLLQSQSGALKASIAAVVDKDGGRLTATVGSFGDVKYAAIQEYGGRTPAHEILPDKAQALAFVVSGALRFARHVSHPGSDIPAHAYLSESFDESASEIVGELANVPKEAWEAR